MPPKQLPWIKHVRSKGRDYYYFDTGKMVGGKKVFAKLPHIHEPEFARVYATLRGHRTRATKTVDRGVTIPVLVDLYQRGDKYAELAANSKRLYDLYLTRLGALLPTAPARAIERHDILLLFDKMGKTPGAANMFLASSGAMFKWAKDRGYIDRNPCDDITPLKVGEHDPWPTPVLVAALASDEPRVRLLTHLLYYTAQRLGDVLKMTWADLRGDQLFVRQQKTGKELLIPLHSALRAELAGAPRASLLIVTAGRAKPMAQVTARKALKDFAATLGADVVPHGLRKNAVIALLEARCSVAETAAISGQSLRLVEYYARQRNQQTLASAAVLSWERNG